MGNEDSNEEVSLYPECLLRLLELKAELEDIDVVVVVVVRVILGLEDTTTPEEEDDTDPDVSVLSDLGNVLL